MATPLDFLAVGDITTDAFIRLEDAHIHCRIDTTACELCVRFAEKIPYEFAAVIEAVGNSPNAAVAASRLGLRAGLISNLGDDQNGKHCLEVLQKELVDTRDATVHPGRLTNYHYVLWYDAERTILVKHEPYPYHFPDVLPPRWLYLSSIGSGSEGYYEEIAAYLNAHPEVKFAFQPGTFQIELGVKKLVPLYKRADIFFCNAEEAKKILREERTIKESLRDLREQGPKLVAITDGPRGAYLFDGATMWFIPPYPDPKPPYERTGAGDAFAATVTVALAVGKSPLEAFSWGPINAMSVVQHIGAQKGLLHRAELETLLKTAPPAFRPQRIA